MRNPNLTTIHPVLTLTLIEGSAEAVRMVADVQADRTGHDLKYTFWVHGSGRLITTDEVGSRITTSTPHILVEATVPTTVSVRVTRRVGSSTHELGIATATLACFDFQR